MGYRHNITAASRVVNRLLGVVCQYQHKDGSFTNNVNITINHNKEVKGDFGIIAGSYVEATILISEVENPRPDDIFIDDDGAEWKVTDLIKITTTKTYVSIIEVVE